MSVVNFKRMGDLGGEALTRFQSNVEQSFKQISGFPFIGGGGFYEVTITSTDPFDIVTTLKTGARGWIVVDTTVVVNFYRTKGTRDSSGVLTLTPSDYGTFKFWVF